MKETKIKVLFVCLGNICRSPAAEGAFSSLLQKENLLEQFHIDSCGTAGYHNGELADPRTRSVAKNRGLNLTHKSRKLTSSDLENFDFILVMDKDNLRTVQNAIYDDSLRKKLYLFRYFEDNSNPKEVPDPYYKDISAFEQVQDIVENASLHFLKYLKSKYPHLKP
ncbi:low molecular weight protein-tyrosine-phosphatase [Leptospira idonii]|uniref:protein-tyrosine-phosphatase n=1 Tax=Leptospira idonii TaxID=1193500 RepID=A0A4R9M335_9LEPT|nr:low molecular weight protein-tyrosine-phosphatase [Leptospira idonii]TGN19709.1 low molecular weight phosphotyrosine protein phosphatase [Leptospira idonii]